MTKRITMLAAVGVLALALTGCEKTTPTYSFSGSIKKSSVACTFYGVYGKAGFTKPDSIKTTCSFSSTAGGGEHPYVIQDLGCSYRFNGQDGQTLSYQTDCLGDGIYGVSYRVCQTHGGPLPDDCGDATNYSFPDQ